MRMYAGLFWKIADGYNLTYPLFNYNKAAAADKHVFDYDDEIIPIINLRYTT